MKLSSMNYLFKQGMRNIWTNRIMSLASFCIMMVSLLLIGFTVVFVGNINLFIGGVENKNEVILILKDDISDDNIEQMGSKLKNMANVSECVFYSKEEAFEDLKASMTEVEDIFSYYEDSPLPDAYKIRVKNIDEMSNTLMDINRIDGIDTIKAPNDFINILIEVKSFISVLFTAIIAALVIVCLVIISNTTRASVDIRKREIAIMKLVGATNSFIKVPFFAEGIMIGVLAGAAALGITCLGYSQIAKLLVSDMTIWSIFGFTGLIPLKDIMFKLVVGYIVAGAGISGIGTVMSTSKYVKV